MLTGRQPKYLCQMAPADAAWPERDVFATPQLQDHDLLSAGMAVKSNDGSSANEQIKSTMQDAGCAMA